MVSQVYVDLTNHTSIHGINSKPTLPRSKVTLGRMQCCLNMCSPWT